MCLTLANATAIIDHHTSQRPAGRGFTRTWHHAAQLSPGDLFRPDPNLGPHTVTEVHRTRDRRNGPDWITLVDQYANPYSYRSNEPVPTAIPDPPPCTNGASARRPTDDHHRPHPVDGTIPNAYRAGDDTNHILKTPGLEMIPEPRWYLRSQGHSTPAPPASRQPPRDSARQGIP